MCLFPRNNYSLRNSCDIPVFNCGVCPECLKQRSSHWALRCYAQSKTDDESCMICLTYDDYIHDSRGKIVGERVSDKHVCVRDVQLFIKRLRKKFPDKNIKYLISAEYGSHTHRPHYHGLLFGISFSDVVRYKKSKRGNWIYRSSILEKIWHNGICTVDKTFVTPASARYCTKYAMKDKGTDTFMLFSHGLGVDWLLKNFNGFDYIVEGCSYPIPRIIWQRYISDCYQGGSVEFSTRYVAKTQKNMENGSYVLALKMRENYRFVRDSDPSYRRYRCYWTIRSARLNLHRKSEFERILALDESKYLSYKMKAIAVYRERQKSYLGASRFPVPRSSEKVVSSWNERYKRSICRIASCLNTANDTNTFLKCIFKKRRLKNMPKKPLDCKIFYDYRDNPFDDPDYQEKKQLSFFEKALDGNV